MMILRYHCHKCKCFEEVTSIDTNKSYKDLMMDLYRSGWRSAERGERICPSCGGFPINSPQTTQAKEITNAAGTNEEIPKLGNGGGKDLAPSFPIRTVEKAKEPEKVHPPLCEREVSVSAKTLKGLRRA